MNFEITIPRNTTESSPTLAHYEVMSPRIKSMEVRIPEGHKFLTRLQIRNYGRILVPIFGSGSVWLRGNDQTIQTGGFALEGPPWSIDLIGWSEDDTFPHTFFIDTD